MASPANSFQVGRVKLKAWRLSYAFQVVHGSGWRQTASPLTHLAPVAIAGQDLLSNGLPCLRVVETIVIRLVASRHDLTPLDGKTKGQAYARPKLSTLLS